MEAIGDLAKALVTLVGGSPTKREASNVRKALDDRMTLSEAIEAATRIVDGYPNGGRDAGRGYIGALAAMLASYPRQVAIACSDRVNGVIRDCRFLPTPADIVAWCEHGTDSLRKQDDRERRIAEQMEEREAYLRQERLERPRRLTIEELKEKYGDWQCGWGSPEDKTKLRETTRRELIAQIGQQAFDALPDGPQQNV